MATDGKTFRKYRLSIDDLDIKLHEKVLLVILEDMIGDNGACWPGMGTLARMVGVCKTTIKTSLARLEAIGEIEVTRPPKHSGKTNRYRCPNRLGSGARDAPPGRAPDALGRAPHALGGAGDALLGRAPDAPLVGHHTPPNQTKQPDSIQPDSITRPPLTPRVGEYDTERPSEEVVQAACAWSGQLLWGLVSPRTRNRIIDAVESHGETSVIEALIWGATPKAKAKSLTRVMSRAARAEMDKDKNNGHSDSDDSDAKYLKL